MKSVNQLNRLFSTTYKKYELLQFYLDKYTEADGKRSEQCDDSKIRMIERLGQEIVYEQSEICALMQKVMKAKNEPQFGLKNDPYYRDFSDIFIHMMNNLSDILALYHYYILQLNPTVFDVFHMKKRA